MTKTILTVIFSETQCTWLVDSLWMGKPSWYITNTVSVFHFSMVGKSSIGPSGWV